METKVEYNSTLDWEGNGKMLAAVMMALRRGKGLKGYFFNFGDGEVYHYRNYSKSVENAAGFMMECAKRENKPVRVFKNMNDEIACALE